MAWYWILYWAGYLISFVIWVVAMAGGSADKKQTLEHAREKDWSTDYAEVDYYSSLWALALAPIVASFVWPAMAAFVLVAVFIMSIGWLLDKAVTATIKEPTND